MLSPIEITIPDPFLAHYFRSIIVILSKEAACGESMFIMLSFFVAGQVNALSVNAVEG